MLLDSLLKASHEKALDLNVFHFSTTPISSTARSTDAPQNRLGPRNRHTVIIGFGVSAVEYTIGACRPKVP